MAPKLRPFLGRSKNLLLSALPSLILFAEFLYRRDWSGEKVAPDVKGILENIARLTSLRTMNSTERDLAIATAVVCTVFFLGAIILRLRERRWLAIDGLLVFVGMTFYSILNPPTSISGGLEVTLRMACILRCSFGLLRRISLAGQSWLRISPPLCYSLVFWRLAYPSTKMLRIMPGKYGLAPRL